MRIPLLTISLILVLAWVSQAQTPTPVKTIGVRQLMVIFTDGKTQLFQAAVPTPTATP